METWPDGFPLPQESLAVDSAAITFRSKNNNGLTNQRHRFQGQTNFLDVSWEFSDAQMASFLGFHKFLIGLGSDWFHAPLVLAGTTTSSIYTVRFFEGKFAHKYIEGIRWMITARLELKDRPTITENDLNGFLGTGGNIMVDDTGDNMVFSDGDTHHYVD